MMRDDAKLQYNFSILFPINQYNNEILHFVTIIFRSYTVSKPKEDNMIIHTVKKGDTLYNLSRRYNVPISRIVADNGIKKGRYLVIGEDLVINNSGRAYTVKEGDTLYSIAEDNGTTVNALFRSNPSLNGNPLIFPGQTLYIEEPSENEIVVNGYAYPFITESELRKALPFLSYLTVFTYGFRDDGTLIVPEDERIIEIAKSYGVSPI
ncbi:MAG: LysM peptidoglycan-binding domain-containing protein, partial [Ruminococcaceae bacterium]|nr:LysM peptidoglycan-binding domain-containing protein [Oscillospiraceae bacterium]